jgi:hypothetical protein
MTPNKNGQCAPFGRRTRLQRARCRKRSAADDMRVNEVPAS